MHHNSSRSSLSEMVGLQPFALIQTVFFLCFLTQNSLGYDNSRGDNVSLFFWIPHLCAQRLCISSLCMLFVLARYRWSLRAELFCRYWGQNSYGATHPSDTGNWQQTISYYCQVDHTIRFAVLMLSADQDSVIDAIPIAFLNVFFSTGGLPSINMANVSIINMFPLAAYEACPFAF